ncbi:MAG: alpha/beta hydrolase [Clostridiales Family XIII bacterium]|jgi:pimeloyl-ACP methyl ester carboxylesterase|nr:alpha/beta hydrolase [Clostridiales Family XIII bacterium]
MGNFFNASDGAKIHYVDMGRGPVLLYVHAFGENMEIKMPFFEPLAQHFRVISFDQRGWGKTEIQGEMSLDRSAKDAKDLVEFLKPEEVYYVGYSMGAADLFAYVRLFGTQYLRRIAIIDMTPCLINKDDWNHGLYQGQYTEEMYKNDLETMDRDFKEFNVYFFTETFLPNNASNKRDFTPTKEKYDNLLVMLKDMPGGAEAMLDLPERQRGVCKAYWISMCENDFRAVLPLIDKPTALIYARPGSLYDEATAEYIASKAQKPSLYPVDGATHMVANTHAAEVLQKIIEFGKKIES